MNLKQKVCALAALTLSTLAQALGGWDAALQVLVGFMAADYATGLLVAGVWHRSAKSESGALSSKASFQGLLKKGVILMMVWVAAMLDRLGETEMIRTAVCLFYIANEGLSLLENTALMGIPYPAFVHTMLDAMKTKNDQEVE